MISPNTTIGAVNNTSSIRYCGGTDNTTGASIQLNGKDTAGNKGVVFIAGNNGTSSNTLAIKPDGSATLDNGNTTKNLAMYEDVFPRIGGNVLTGNKIAKVNSDSDLSLCGGMNLDSGSSVNVFGKSFPLYGLAGAIRLITDNGSNAPNMYMYPNGTWSWQGTACQITSDQRYKQQITQIDNALLDAWEDVTLCQFKYNDAVEQKGNDNARLHTGYVVQQIDDACKSHNVDISEYGLYCHEEYPQETEEVEVKQDDGSIKKETKVIREASEHYSLRYTEALIVECAYLRREINRLKEQMKK